VTLQDDNDEQPLPAPARGAVESQSASHRISSPNANTVAVEPPEAPADSFPGSESSPRSTTAIPRDKLIGSTLDGRYFIENELGQGGVGVVYLARDRKLLDKRVVVKVLLESSLQNEWTVRKFQQEKEALARVDHPGIVGILDTGELPDGKAYIVMQYVDGVTLRSVIPGEGMGLERAATIAKQMGAALTAVHEKKIYHRDLKPENVMLQILSNGDELVKIVDFGIAKVKDSLLAPSTVVPATAGTIVYMSPEQLRGEKVTAMSDIYSMGVIAYEMVTGRRPFNPQTMAHLSEMQREGVRVKPKDLRPVLPEAAQDVILKALSYQPQNRYQSACEFGAALAQELLSDEEPTTRNLLDEKSTERFPVQAKSARARKLPIALIVTAVLAVVVLGVAAMMLTNKWRGAAIRPEPARGGDAGAAKLPDRSLSYWLTVQKMRDGKPYQQPFQTSGQEIFENGWKFRMNISSPQEGYLYLLNEGPAARGATTYNMLFPEPKTNGGSARVAAAEKLQTAWMRFDEHQGTEKFWIVWSASQVKELDDLFLTGIVYERQKGEISDPDQAKAMRDFLDKHSSPKPEVSKDSAGEKTTVKGGGDVLVSNVELSHH